MLVRTLAAWLVIASLCLMPLSGGASNSIEALLRQAEVVRSSDPDAFQKILRQLNAENKQATPKQQEQLSYLNAYAEAYAGRYDSAAEQAGRIVEKSGDVNLQFRAGALMVNSYAATRKFAEGLRQLERTMLLIDKIKDPELRQHGLFVAAYIYSQIGQNKLALQYADQILSERAPERTLCFTGQLKQEALHNLKALPVDDAQIIRVIDQCIEVHEVVLANTVRGTLARKWVAQGRRDKAVALLQEHLDEVEATRFPRLIGETHSLLAEYLLADGDLAKAEAHAEAAIANRISLSNSPPLAAAYKTLFDIAERRHDLVAALGHYRNYADADKNYLNDVKARELAYQIVRHESQQKTQEIELLNGQNQVLRLQQRVDRQASQNTHLLLALLTFLIAGIAYWAYKIKRVQMSLRRFAETDALTNISNRHHFTQQTEQALVQSAKAGEPCALIMFDLDHFKAINDGYGHDTGDWVLKRVAETCKGHCRRIDHLGRLGGEEFAILLQGVDLRAATRLAEDCRVRMAQIDTRGSGYTFVVTASFGVSATPFSGYSLRQLLSHADLMLYSAKRAGRNRVHVYSGESLTPPQLQVVSRNDEFSARRDGSLSPDDVQESLRS
ncbi:MAG: diguanylate cyclase [Lysobacter sp.]